MSTHCRPPLQVNEIVASEIVASLMFSTQDARGEFLFCSKIKYVVIISKHSSFDRPVAYDVPHGIANHLACLCEICYASASVLAEWEELLRVPASGVEHP